MRRARATLHQLTRDLLAEAGREGCWCGFLAPSALSTAVATIALGEIDRREHTTRHLHLVERGLEWLAANANADGGWGDTTVSRSNLSTTALCWAAFGAARADEQFPETVARARRWILDAVGSEHRLVQAIEARYGDDRTFSVPIVLTLALSGRLGPDGWSRVRPLPFELAAFPRSWFGALRLPVVSYALPALIALGQAIHHHAPSPNPFARAARTAVARHTLARMVTLQPDNGGFLEATPLTAFVAMSLASMGLTDHEVTRRAAGFLRQSVRADGSWPIDTNLSTWVTTLAVKALRHQPGTLSAEHAAQLTRWLLDQQYRDVHPYTGAAPGGWAWTPLPGGVPDADDTAGALLALRVLRPEPTPDEVAAAGNGVRWLLDLQNGDGGLPTFCRGWGRLPFDRSAPELTAHALRAWAAWRDCLPQGLQPRIDSATARAQSFLIRSQRSDGSWIPLWFGNEHAPDEANPVYGTAQVLLALNHFAEAPSLAPAREGAIRFLLNSASPGGGWGGARGCPPSIEETAVALAALAGAQAGPAVQEGLRWLLDALDEGWDRPQPIGFYFARLWYWERLYPLIFATDALGAVLPPAP